MAKLKTKSKTNPPVKSEDVPVTQSMLYEVREELKSEMTANAIDLKSDIKQLDSKMNQMELRLDSKMVQMGLSLDSKIDKLTSVFKTEFDKMNAGIHRNGLLVEEQNAKNNYVLDGYTSLNDRIEKLENPTET